MYFEVFLFSYLPRNQGKQVQSFHNFYCVLIFAYDRCLRRIELQQEPLLYTGFDNVIDSCDKSHDFDGNAATVAALNDHPHVVPTKLSMICRRESSGTLAVHCLYRGWVSIAYDRTGLKGSLVSIVKQNRNMRCPNDVISWCRNQT